MGYIAHHAIVVTAGRIEHAVKARQKARALGLQSTKVVESKINGYASFLIIPDGSKEGWDASNAAAVARNQWIEWAKAARKESIWLDWALVRFGGDNPELAALEDHNESTY